MMNPDEEQQVPAVANRSQEFGSGMIGGQVAPPASLQETAARYNASVPRNYRPSGSGIGMSAGQATATFGGMFRNPNGSATDTWETKRYFEGSPE